MRSDLGHVARSQKVRINTFGAPEKVNPDFEVEIHEPKSGGGVFEVKALTMREVIKKVLDSRDSTGLFGGPSVKVTVTQIK